MQYTSVILLGFLNAFTLAAPLTHNQIRSPIPPEAAAAVANAEITAANAIAGGEASAAQGISAGEAAAAGGIATANAAIAEYVGRK